MRLQQSIGAHSSSFCRFGQSSQDLPIGTYAAARCGCGQSRIAAARLPGERTLLTEALVSPPYQVASLAFGPAPLPICHDVPSRAPFLPLYLRLRQGWFAVVHIGEQLVIPERTCRTRCTRGQRGFVVNASRVDASIKKATT